MIVVWHFNVKQCSRDEMMMLSSEIKSENLKYSSANCSMRMRFVSLNLYIH